MNGILLCDDLMFLSRITGTACDLGLSVTAVRSPALLLERTRGQPPACVILDLSNPSLDIAGLVADLRGLASPPRIIAFGSHVDTATLQRARAAGCDEVLPRSQFVAQLPNALPRWLTPPDGAGS